jgi:hypothetical protein
MKKLSARVKTHTTTHNNNNFHQRRNNSLHEIINNNQLKKNFHNNNNNNRINKSILLNKQNTNHRVQQHQTQAKLRLGLATANTTTVNIYLKPLNSQQPHRRLKQQQEQQQPPVRRSPRMLKTLNTKQPLSQSGHHHTSQFGGNAVSASAAYNFPSASHTNFFNNLNNANYSNPYQLFNNNNNRSGTSHRGPVNVPQQLQPNSLNNNFGRNTFSSNTNSNFVPNQFIQQTAVHQQQPQQQAMLQQNQLQQQQQQSSQQQQQGSSKYPKRSKAIKINTSSNSSNHFRQPFGQTVPTSRGVTHQTPNNDVTVNLTNDEPRLVIFNANMSSMVQQQQIAASANASNSKFNKNLMQFNSNALKFNNCKCLFFIYF